MPAGLLDPSSFAGDPALIAGIAAYRRHPWHRDLADPPAIWREGAARLLDFGPADAPPVVFVPSLVNRAHVLDLMDGQSMLRFLAQGGVRPLLLDWGFPGAVERAFTLTDYIAGPLERALGAVGQPVVLVGYCMGGLMAVSAALRRPDLVSRLALLATPWDFWSPDRAGARRLAECLPWLEPWLGFDGTLPIDALQMLFSVADPGSVGRKYRDFGAQDQASARAARFVAIEDWLNDGVPLAAPVAREVLGGWYGANTPANGTWRVAGAVVRPEALRLDSFVAIPAQDRIVPPESALALARLLPGATIVRPQAGHIGMVAGSRAEEALWVPLLRWLGVGPNGPGRTPASRRQILVDVEELAHAHGVSVEAVRVLQDAIRRGGGRAAQFSHPELGGMGQWSSGGMTQIGAMFDNGLRDRVAALCAALAQDGSAQTMPRTPDDHATWWPQDLGHPSATGAQNGMRYACFPETRRVVVEQAGVVTIYDSGEHRIGGVSQAGELLFTSQLGTVRAQDLPVAK